MPIYTAATTTNIITKLKENGNSGIAGGGDVDTGVNAIASSVEAVEPFRVTAAVVVSTVTRNVPSTPLEPQMNEAYSVPALS